MTITEFLTARYNEDEAMARRATEGPWTVEAWSDSYSVRSAPYPGQTPGGTGTSEVMRGSFYVHNSDRNAAFVAHNNSARVLADIAAKRAIVALMDDPQRDTYEIHEVLILLAQQHAEHPDFDPDWR